MIFPVEMKDGEVHWALKTNFTDIGFNLIYLIGLLALIYLIGFNYLVLNRVLRGIKEIIEV